MKTWQILALIFLGIQLVGCLDIEIEETVFLEQDGSGTYQVQVSIYDEPGEEPAGAELEEHLTGEGSIAEELKKMGAVEVEVILIRDRSPLEYVVQGKFSSSDPILEAVFENMPAIWWEDTHTDEGRSLIFRFEDHQEYDPNWERSEEIEIVAVGGWIEKGASNTMLEETDPSSGPSGRKAEETQSRIRLVRWSDWRDLSFHWKNDQKQ